MVLKRPIGTGGMQLQARRVAARLRGLGVECFLVAQARSASGAAALRQLDLPVVVLRTQHGALFHSLLAACLWRRRRDYDLIHVHGSGMEAVTAALAGAVVKRPVLVKPSTAGPGTRLGSWASHPRPWVRWLLAGGISRWIAISERTRRDLLQAGVPEERIALVPNGVDTRRCRPLPAAERNAVRASLAVPGDALVMTAVARLTPHKRIDLLLRAVAGLRGDPRQRRLWVIGSGTERDRLLLLAQRLGVRAEFSGALPPGEVLRRLQVSDIYVACSEWEGMSNALLEAMACGVAPVSSQVSGAEDLIVDGENGRLLMPGDEAALRAALAELAADAPLRERLGQAARTTVCARCDLGRTARLLLEEYRAALHPAPRRELVASLAPGPQQERSWDRRG